MLDLLGEVLSESVLPIDRFLRSGCAIFSFRMDHGLLLSSLKNVA
jgi:hypothetical protein